MSLKHRRTDPACRRHRPPRGWWSRWRYECGRGRACELCMHARQYGLGSGLIEAEVQAAAEALMHRGETGSIRSWRDLSDYGRRAYRADAVAALLAVRGVRRG